MPASGVDRFGPGFGLGFRAVSFTPIDGGACCGVAIRTNII